MWFSPGIFLGKEAEPIVMQISFVMLTFPFFWIKILGGSLPGAEKRPQGSPTVRESQLLLTHPKHQTKYNAFDSWNDFKACRK